MAVHITIGKEGEELALRFLRKKDFEILTVNWRYSHYEIDVVAVKEDVVHFIEVKTRYNRSFGYPEESVSKKKFRSIKKGAEFFMRKYPRWKRIQFDILAISRSKSGDEYFFIEDVYI